MIRTSRGERAGVALAMLALMGGVSIALGQQPSTSATPGAAESSVEQGRTELDQSFDFREYQLEARRKAFEDTKFEFNFRTYYFDRHKFDGSESEAWAIGGWGGFKTGYFLGHIAFGATAYTSQPLHAPDDKDGTLLLKPGQEGYTVLGEAYADIKIVDGLNLNIGRKGYDTPFINRNDVRMTPNTFEAIVLQGKVDLEEPATVAVNKDGMALSTDAKEPPAPAPPPKQDLATLKYGVGFFHQIKERNSDVFVSMATDAGADVERGVYTAGVIYEKGKFSIGGIDYYCDDIINIGYGETKFEIPITDKVRPRISAQFVDERSTGNDLLFGRDFSVQQFGLKAEVPIQKVLFTAAFTHASGGDTNLQGPWSGYPGYTSVQVQDFNRAGENAFLFRIGYDFPWVDGLSAYALAVFGTTPDAAGQYRQDEYDANLQWAPKKGCLKGLSMRVRYAEVEQHGGNVDNLTDFRVIVNYLIKF